MLRIHFTDVDLARTRLAAAPDPLSEISASLHRLQSRRGRWAFAGWYRTTRQQLREKGLERVLRSVLLPLYPRAAYFPDFLTPVGAVDGLDVGLESILATPPQRVMEDLAILDRTSGAPAWAWQLAGLEARKEFVGMLRACYDVVVAPHKEQVQTRIEAERAARCRGFLDGGVEGMLAGLGPMLRWRPPVLEVAYPKQVDDRDLHLNGRGLTLVPSYFNWGEPVILRRPGTAARTVVLAAPRARSPSSESRRPRRVPDQPARARPGGRSAHRVRRRHDRRDRPRRRSLGLRRQQTRHHLARRGTHHHRPERPHRAAHPHTHGCIPAARRPAQGRRGRHGHPGLSRRSGAGRAGEPRSRSSVTRRRRARLRGDVHRGARARPARLEAGVGLRLHHRQTEATPASPTSAGRLASPLRPAECRALLMLAAISRMTGDMTAAEHHTADARHIQRETGCRPVLEPQ
jgi:hypothetical protein